MRTWYLEREQHAIRWWISLAEKIRSASTACDEILGCCS
jgi:hypothetical protein